MNTRTFSSSDRGSTARASMRSVILFDISCHASIGTPLNRRWSGPSTVKSICRVFILLTGWRCHPRLTSDRQSELELSEMPRIGQNHKTVDLARRKSGNSWRITSRAEMLLPWILMPRGISGSRGLSGTNFGIRAYQLVFQVIRVGFWFKFKPCHI